MHPRRVLSALGASASLAQAQLFDQSLHADTTLTTPCFLLNRTFPGAVVGRGDARYENGQSTYWSVQQSELAPACRFLPKSAQEIQEALADIIIPYDVQIAVVSGGHSSNVGASNVRHGITIDLGELGGAMVVEDGREVLIGPAARWKDVYYVTEPENVTVAGGRVGHVGAAGYLLGGGLSWFSEQHGWACDSIVELQVVTPMGEILDVNNHTHADLFWALKGSAGAFGIVTRITMATVENTGIFGGPIGYEQRYIPRILDALERLTVDAPQNPNTHGYLSMAWNPAEREFGYSMYLVNTDDTTWNEPFRAFTVVPHRFKNFRHMTVRDGALELDNNNPLGLRRSKFTLTTRPQSRLMLDLHEIIKAGVGAIQFDADGLLGVTFQPLTEAFLQASPGNLFSLNADDGPLLIISVEFWWSEPRKDEYFEQVTKHLRGLLEQEIDRHDAHHPFIYPNYAAADQNPLAAIASTRTQLMLSQVKQKYDPYGLWQKHVPGIWHVE